MAVLYDYDFYHDDYDSIRSYTDLINKNRTVPKQLLSNKAYDTVND